MSAPAPSGTSVRLLLVLAAASAATGAAVEPVIVPRFTHPGAGQTCYFLLTDRFANGNHENDTGGLAGGPDVHGFDPTRVSHYHGGDFAGLRERLDYLQRLGITAVWLTPPLKNKPVQSGTAAYHGYWITDFLQMDPHLGTNAEFRELVQAAHARGLRVYMDIIANHTADVITYRGGGHEYLAQAEAPYRDARGAPFSPEAVAYNGLADPAEFPALAALLSFPHAPVVPPAEQRVKHPDWLNDVTLYHNRGNTTFTGENSVHGDFVGLDDLFTEHPRVVQGLTEIFAGWLESGVDGYRIDTVRHVNNAFWQAFAPALRARARGLDRPDFLMFAEVAHETGGAAVLSEFSTHLPIDTTLDFGFFTAARRFVSQGGPAAALAEFFEQDDYYTDHDSNVHATTTFLGNHDAGRFGYFLRQDNPEASEEQLMAMVRLGHGLLYLARGQPVLYYGDEQGLMGRGGHDMQARESLFASRAPDFRDARLLGTDRTGADDKYDETHPFYRLFAELGALRAAHRALRTGALVPRRTAVASVGAFSRWDRDERIEYLVALNRDWHHDARVAVPTSQPAGRRLQRIFTSAAAAGAAPAAVTVGTNGAAEVALRPGEFAVWRAEAEFASRPLPPVRFVRPTAGQTLTFATREIDGLEFPTRQAIEVELNGHDGLAEVTFTLERSSRPEQYDLLGVDDTPPYLLYWSPPSDLREEETLALQATCHDLRGGTVVARVEGLRIAGPGVALGIQSAETPTILRTPVRQGGRTDDEPFTLRVEARGTPPLEYQWLRDGAEMVGAIGPVFHGAAGAAGVYRVQVRNRAGTALSRAITVGPDGD